MKKFFYILMLCISCSVSVVFGATKGTMDEAKAREQILNEANKYFGYKYPPSLERAAPAGTIDCSHFFYQSLKGAGLNGADGKGYITTAGLRNLKNTKNIPATQLKPGDAILMHPKPGRKYGHVMIVRKVLPNGQVEIIDSSSGNGVKIRTISYPPNRYSGTVSVTDMIISNGYTPVNSSGQVITPPAGSSTNSSERKTSFDPNKGTKGKTEQTLEINFNKISNRIVEYIVDGAKEYFPDLKILLSILFAFELYFFFYEGFSGANEKLWTAFGRKILKFGFYLAVLENYLNILVFMYNFFLGIAQEFVGDAALLKIFELDNSADGINLIFSIMGEAMIVLLKTLNNWGIGLFEPLDSFYRLILILIILGCMLIVTIRYLFEIFIVKTQFFLAGGLASIFLPFEVFEKTKEIGGSRTLRAVLGGGFLVTALAIVGTVSYDILKEYIVNEATTVDYLDLMKSFRFIMVCWIILKLMGSVREMLEKVMR